VEPVQGISRVNLRRNLDLSMLMPTLPVQATPMAAWRLEDYWVTAVKLQNTSSSVIALDPRLLQGDFIAATFQHSDLGPAGHATDTTVIYLVTHKHGLADSILPAMSQIDALTNVSVDSVQGGNGYEK
jgi:integrating conjugative element protein (TIGR03749 family)